MQKNDAHEDSTTQQAPPVPLLSGFGPSPVMRHSFVVRIWREGDGAAWRGRVEHTRTGDALFVQALQELLAFIESYAGTLAPVLPAEHGGDELRTGERAGTD